MQRFLSGIKRECGAARQPNAATAPATVSGEPETTKATGRNPGKAALGDDPRARRPAVIRGHARKHRAGLEPGDATGWFGSLKYRYSGRRPLTEDGYLSGPATGTGNARLGYRWADGWRLQLDAFNIFNSRSDQITYGYGSLLPTDALYQQCLAGVAPGSVCGVGVMDRHFKPVEPPAVRVTLGGPLPAF